MRWKKGAYEGGELRKNSTFRRAENEEKEKGEDKLNVEF